MESRHEDIVRKFEASWGDGTDQHPDVTSILSTMSNDIVWKPSVPNGTTITGKDAVKNEILRQFDFTAYLKYHNLNMCSNERIVILERVDTYLLHGKPIKHSLVAIYEIDDDGLIGYWREYFDAGDIAAQLSNPSRNAANQA